jgi:thiol-disulfide isomerase/thioredoxin
MGRRVRLALQAAAVLVVALLVVLLGWQVFRTDEARGLAAKVEAGEAPPAPVFDLEQLDADQTMSLASLRGKAVVLNFWASWCAPCQAETPILRQLDLEYRDRGLSIVGISVQESNVADVAAYVQKYALGYTVAADLDGDIFRQYKVYVLPTQFFIAPDGRIATVTLGPLDASAARQRIDAILPR